ncbi:DEAD/DEAH box helicase [Lacinutrix sp. C3R15]|uniref:DEAD/DEAH box helicase n=1 Tax=Flavobacteriaceae TaxID=49546 RepID=UPI001C09F0B5|nr:MULTISPECIES: DEAD/DEAH box helicase [Flavobacteriaceae]MBU2940257.1 DEAD/DEAH box helicase [Lacinutrix sp. C3R15]MDO6623576.1 DEAD/DEAH box helicase [Oceanihabitans sp. 1_MG-2023]
MSFKKLNPLLKEALNTLEFEAPLAFQKKILPKLKGGANVYGLAPAGFGKTTALIIATIHKLKAEAFEDSPRALILVKDKQAALDLKAEFEKFTRRTDLRIYAAYEEQTLDQQREEIYYGVDVLIATPKRLNKLYFMNSVHLGQLQIFALDDAEFLIRNNYHNDVLRVTESIQKCQYIILAESMHSKYERLQESFMYHAQIVKME